MRYTPLPSTLLRRLQIPLAFVAGSVLTTAALQALGPTPKHVFQAGTVVSAQQVNENIAELSEAASQCQAVLGQAQSKLTLLQSRLDSPRFCAYTPETWHGAGPGLDTIRFSCTKACGSSTAHLCTSHDVARVLASAPSDGPPAFPPTAKGAWYQAGMKYSLDHAHDASKPLAYVADCGGFALEAINEAEVWREGAALEPTGRGFTAYTCQSQLPFACCD